MPSLQPAAIHVQPTPQPASGETRDRNTRLWELFSEETLYFDVLYETFKEVEKRDSEEKTRSWLHKFHTAGRVIACTDGC